MVSRYIVPAAIAVVTWHCLACGADWKPASGPLMTKWAQAVRPENVHAEYPRPQMVRDEWLNLNGLWDYAIAPKDSNQPQAYAGPILVPFPVESALSGVMKPVGPDNRLWYRRTVTLPEKWATDKKRILLHFGAVDWETTVWVNGKQVGTHRGGYDPFTFDITDAVKPNGAQEIVVSVWDPTDAGDQPRGKQVLKPNGIWYTAVTGIWQTVWLEPVPDGGITRLQLTPDIDAGTLQVIVEGLKASDALAVEAVASADGRQVASATGPRGGASKLSIPNAKLWSPESPFVYDLKVTLKRDGQVVDAVKSYFAMRKTSLGKDEKGVLRLCLNNKPLFQYGPLDQGWWPDGLYTAPNDEALKYDIEVTRQLGMNMARKHVKVEPERWYYWCDRLGLLVWQDMPSANNKTTEGKKQFEAELARMMEALHNHPCIVMWVPFNEGWGQYDTERVTEMVKKLDPSRLVDNASGWTDRKVGDVHDIHVYPGPGTPPVEPTRAAVLGEFGGLGLPLSGHTWQAQKNWGYRSFTSAESLTSAYLALVQNLRPLIADGLSAAVYTQTTDVEIEINGLMTYDRALMKMDAAQVRAASATLYLPPPAVVPVAPTSQKEGQAWLYTTTAPVGAWQVSDFNDSGWQIGTGGFGVESTPGTVVRTQWKTADIWMRRSFDLKDAVAGRLYLSVHHDEDAEVYLNGQRAAKLQGYTSSYILVSIEENARAALKPGRNTLAVHCHQIEGGQYIDVGLVEVREQPQR